MDIRFQQHLLQIQANEMVKYIETLEKNNKTMLQFIQEQGLGEMFANIIEPKEVASNPVQESSPVEVQQ